ncbi:MULTISPECIES: VOC family protein [unclassified Streptomyces]|uniref:VOC family protein n=1 Tax=unclassified Streptomyces TaxID=2593676 RepID=UPI002257D928|nr:MULTISPECIES: VOC family protein [unclassified Streptomyces]MCX4406431.1 VOC family protein [Streptomyces sp. NBC_01764]MCX5189045.1 VOC family protein [Streptomyces sp. NBC_00268]
MPVELNHTIIYARDNRESAEFLAHILGLKVGTGSGPFIPVATSNGVTLDFAVIPAESIVMQHYAFLVSDEEFDAAFARIQQAGITYYADPHLKQPGEINHHCGGRGLYFMDPAGHGMEIITRPVHDRGSVETSPRMSWYTRQSSPKTPLSPIS